MRAEAWWPARLPLPHREALVGMLSDAEAARLCLAEQFGSEWLRADQRPPAGAWRVWVLFGGRGAGKNFAGSHWVIRKAKENPGCRIALVARSAADVRDTVVLGPSGILACSPPWFYPVYKPTLRRLEWPNGAIGTTYSAAEPDLLRGPQHWFALADEIGFWRDSQAWSNLELGLRSGPHPQAAAASTPAATDLVLDLVQGPKDKATGLRVPRPDVVVTRSSMLANRANLAEDHVRAMLAMANTPRGRAEVYGELIEAAEDALWDLETLAACHSNEGLVMSPERIVVGFDPSHSPDGSGDEAGIVTAVLRSDGMAIVVADESLRAAPVDCWLAAFDAADGFRAQEIVYEDNPSPTVKPSFVGDTLKLALKQRKPPSGLKLIPVHSSTSKYRRAEPVAAAYRAGRVLHHTNADLASLESEMVTWSPSRTKSPNRLDALVIAVSRLLLIEKRAPLVLA